VLIPLLPVCCFVAFLLDPLDPIEMPHIMQVCAKVFASKRKVYNVAAARVAGTEAAKFFDPKKGQPKGGSTAQVTAAYTG